MAKICLTYFLEDRLQEGFITALVKRISSEEGVRPEKLYHDVRSGRGGSRVAKEFQIFLREMRKYRDRRIPDIIVVAIDGNCKGRAKKIRELKKGRIADAPLWDRIALAIPDPHIERWYLLDQAAFRDAMGGANPPSLPDYKCERDYYKKLLREAVNRAGAQSLLGGPEFAERIVANMNLNLLASRNAGFATFSDELRRLFRMRTRIA